MRNARRILANARHARAGVDIGGATWPYRRAYTFLLIAVSCAAPSCDDEPSECASFDAPGPLVECEPGEPGCYVIGEWRLLGPTLRGSETQGCTQTNDNIFDQCNCAQRQGDFAGAAAPPADGGAGDPGEPVSPQRCPEGETCVLAYSPPQIGLGGPGGYQNVCRRLCLSDDECVGEQRCWAGNCLVPECLRDADCTERACGHCTPTRTIGHAGAVNMSNLPTCVYPPW